MGANDGQTFLGCLMPTNVALSLKQERFLFFIHCLTQTTLVALFPGHSQTLLLQDKIREWPGNEAAALVLLCCL